uniref:Uncharacterized protein n=1 Tax=Ananas comosus var. bracteatus TaxID=296719 RepID=A0A6V7QMU8_ANACO|nr:unnamed protein product [Ananas comosus var. bracteatus]
MLYRVVLLVGDRVVLLVGDWFRLHHPRRCLRSRVNMLIECDDHKWRRGCSYKIDLYCTRIPGQKHKDEPLLLLLLLLSSSFFFCVSSGVSRMGTRLLLSSVLFALCAVRFAAEFVGAETPAAVVVGSAVCSDCATKKIEHERAFNGLHAAVKCKAATGLYETKAMGELDNTGIRFPPKSHYFPPKSHYFPPVYKKPLPSPTPVPTYKPPVPVYKPPFRSTSRRLRSTSPRSGLQAPVPVYKPPTPVYKPPVPVYKPPVPVYKPPTPVYKPPTPVYKPVPFHHLHPKPFPHFHKFPPYSPHPLKKIFKKKHHFFPPAKAEANP